MLVLSSCTLDLICTMTSLCVYKFIIYTRPSSHGHIYLIYTSASSYVHMYFIYTVPSLHAHINLMDTGYSSYSVYFPYTWYFHNMLTCTSCTLDLHHMLACMLYMWQLPHMVIYIYTHIYMPSWDLTYTFYTPDLHNMFTYTSYTLDLYSLCI